MLFYYRVNKWSEFINRNEYSFTRLWRSDFLKCPSMIIVSIIRLDVRKGRESITPLSRLIKGKLVLMMPISFISVSSRFLHFISNITGLFFLSHHPHLKSITGLCIHQFLAGSMESHLVKRQDWLHPEKHLPPRSMGYSNWRTVRYILMRVEEFQSILFFHVVLPTWQIYGDV